VSLVVAHTVQLICQRRPARIHKRREKTGDSGAVQHFHERTAERYTELRGHSKGVLMKAGQIFSMVDASSVGSSGELSPYQKALTRLQADAPGHPPAVVWLSSMVSNRHPLRVAPILVLTRSFRIRLGLSGHRPIIITPYSEQGDSVANEADVVAVVNADADRVAIWHVVVSPSYPMSRLCGAWVYAAADPVATRVDNLVATRIILPFGGQLPDTLAYLASASAGVIDVSATFAAISERIAKLDKLHESSRNAVGKSRARIDWPPLPPALDWASPPSPPAGAVDEPFIRSTIGVARWVADLADTWSVIETKRLSREHLAAGDTRPQPLPVVLVETVPA
jgi:hypothetical protein